jgi:hypothetical protein
MITHKGHGHEDHGHEDMMAIPDKPDRHAFITLGSKRLFLCHMTMFHMEAHCYQIVLEASLPDAAMKLYRREREAHPGETYFLGNVPQDLFTVPQIAIAARSGFIADIWRGIPHKKQYTEWPWTGLAPTIASIAVKVERVIFFRHFDFNLEFPAKLSYILFGAGTEAFLTHFQVKEPDFDHIVTLARAPEWLPEEQLRAGAPINVPSLSGTLKCWNPLQKGTHEVQFAGFPVKGKPLTIDVARSEWFCTKIVNSSNPCPDEGSCEAGEPLVGTSFEKRY